MEFVNQGNPVQVRENDGLKRYKWKLLKKGEKIDLPEKVGKRYGFKKIVTTQRGEVGITKGKIGEKIVETKQFEVGFLKELESIKGIGNKTAKDIYKVFRNKERLIRAISHDDELPFRDDIEEKLRREYGN